MDWIGLASGFLTALLSAGAFLSSTWALKRTPGLTSSGLMLNAALVMGLLAWALLLGFWDSRLFTEGFLDRVPILIGSTLFFSLGQIAIFAAQKHVEASRIVPLLGLKLPLLAVISVICFEEHIGIFQILAIALAILAAFVLNNAGKAIPLKALGYVLGGSCAFCLSDICLTLLTKRLHSELGFSMELAALHCTALTYILLGITAAAILPQQRKAFTRSAILHSIPYSVFWITCIVVLSFCFGRLGTVNGIILQNTRGVFAVILTPICIWFGCTALENKMSPAIFWRRMAAALMVLGAVFLYNFR